MLNDTYAYVRARWVILVSIVGMVAPIFVCALLFPSWRNGLNSSLQPLENAVFGVVSYGFTGVLLWLIWGRNLGWGRIFGSFPNAREVWILLSLGIPNVGLSIVGMNLVFLPLSYVAPGVVSWWLLEPEPPDFICGFSLGAILVNGIQGVQTALVVPIVEEVVFRGFVLHRWCDKYGVKRGIVQASILFSILHKELLGNFVGSVIVSVFCLRTKSLVGSHSHPCWQQSRGGVDDIKRLVDWRRCRGVLRCLDTQEIPLGLVVLGNCCGRQPALVVLVCDDPIGGIQRQT